MTLAYTIEQVRDRETAQVGIIGIPNIAWPLATGNYCLAFQLWAMGARSRADVDLEVISIARFRAVYHWQEVGMAAAQPGDMLAQHWDDGETPADQPNHIGLIYSISRSAGTITTVEGNTGPEPGVPTPVGIWKKTRPLGDWALFTIRPPYKAQAAALSNARKAQVRLVAAYINGLQVKGGPRTTAASDGIPGVVYWTLIQRWGRQHGQYGPTYTIDGIPGPRTRAVEAILYTAAKKAAAHR